MVKILVIVLMAMSAELCLADPATPIVVTYPASDSNPFYYKRVRYFVDVLNLALRESGKPYTLKKVNLPFLKEVRSERYLQQGVYDVHWLNTQQWLEDSLLPIRIPLFKGLIGWRIFFIRAADQDKFSSIDNLDQLKRLVAGQGHDWPDTVLFEQEHFRQETSSSWEGMFMMLNRGRIDYFPRSVLEIWDERDAYPKLDLAIESHLLLRYPAAYYFFVRKDNIELANDIELGLNKAIDDGSFNALFNKYFGERLQHLNIDNRKVFDLQSHPLPKGAPLDRPELWYHMPSSAQ